ncbi:MAG TPA: hypothetical protein VG096_05285 [Bryobacteraceae bacterium]|jgi:hypothetical protein|nr:hypothetical protein [Bryobacteraceae bacterium]
MSFFDFSDEVGRATREAKDDVSRLSARTTIGRMRFPDSVARAGFSLLTPGRPFSPAAYDHVLVVGVATWSDPDLATLEKLAADSDGRDVKIVVFDLDDWSLGDILGTFPGVAKFKATPVVLEYRGSDLALQSEGRDATLWLDRF